MPFVGREPSGLLALDASEIDADAEELNAPREDAVVHAPAVDEEHAAEPVSDDALVAAATSSGDMSVVHLAETLARAAAVERAALAGRRAATSALAEARRQLLELHDQQHRLCEAEDFDAAEAMNAPIAEAEAAVAAAESVLSAAEYDVAAAALAALAASAAELAAWDDAALRLTGPQARARKREALEAERVSALERQASACAKAAKLSAERDALAAALAAMEQQLTSAQLEEAEASRAVGSLETAISAVYGGPTSDAALLPPAVAERMQAAVDSRRHAHATRERAVTLLRALAAEEETAAAALAASKQREAAHARDVALALAAHASALQVITSARQNVARLVAEADRASEQKAVAIASKNFKVAAALTNSIRELSKEHEAAEANLQSLSGRLMQADEQVRELQSQTGARAADVHACARVAALARWRRLRAELQTAQQDEQLRADADALAAEHGFSDADDV